MNIEIFSDLVCPWCYIGKRRLDQALEIVGRDDVNVVWRAYQLYPDMPAGGMDRTEFARLRYRNMDQSAVRTRIEEEAARSGIRMRFARIERMPNTFRGHRLLHFARSAGVQHELAERLFSAYFEEGEDVGDDAVLLEAAAAVGMDRQQTAEFLAGDGSVDAVRDELSRAGNIGVTGVPCFLFEGAFALSGAQEPEVMAQFLTRVREKLAETA